MQRRDNNGKGETIMARHFAQFTLPVTRRAAMALGALVLSAGLAAAADPIKMGIIYLNPLR